MTTWESIARRALRTTASWPLFCCLAVGVVAVSYTVGRWTHYPRSGSFEVVHKARSRAASITIEPTSGIQIVARAPQNMFPADWFDPDSPTSASSPVPELVPYAILGIERALHKYPARFLKKNLTRVYIVNNLVVDGQPSGGVNAPELKTIYVDLDNLDSDEAASWAEETIHHEFAHLLADNHPKYLSLTEWSRINSPDFAYGHGGTDAIRMGKDGDEVTDKYLSQGFVEEYSMSDPDEDFATLCERMFSGDRVVRRAEARYPRLRHKADMVVSFYHSMDSTFTDSYFSKLAPSSVD